MLLRYISALGVGNAAEAEKVRKKSRSTIARRVGLNNLSAIVYCLLVLVLIVLLVLKDQGVLSPIDSSSSEENRSTPTDTQLTDQDSENIPTNEPKDEIIPSITASQDAPYLGDYVMVSEYENAGAVMTLYYSNGGEICVVIALRPRKFSCF